MNATNETFPVGARVYVDGRDEAIIVQVFPEGSTSLLSAHYCVRFVGGGPEQVKVAMSRVGVERREHCAICHERLPSGEVVCAKHEAPVTDGDARGGDNR
jgi:hypothetical protein